MTEKTQKKMIQEVHQGLFGVEGTDDKGMIGDFKGLEKHVRERGQNVNGEFAVVHNRITKLSTKVWLIIGLLGSSGGGVGIWQLVEKING